MDFLHQPNNIGRTKRKLVTVFTACLEQTSSSYFGTVQENIWIKSKKASDQLHFVKIYFTS